MPDAATPRIPVLVGPTGIGKTAVATALARLTPIEIISADSRQVYRGLDIGTAKPDAEARAAAPYHGLDLVDPRERYSAGRFAREAAGWIAGTLERGRLPVVVGGTGFYIRALFEGLFAEPELDAAVRTRLAGALRSLPAGEAARWAARLDPGFAGGGGTQRAVRAVEVALLAGVPLSRLQRERPAAQSVARPFYALMTLSRGALAERIAHRVAAMLAGGLVDEVRAVLAAGVPAEAPGMTGVGYREVVRHLAGTLGAEALAGEIAAATRRYAKRQDTWFRHQLGAAPFRLDAAEPADTLAKALLAGYRAARQE